MDTPLGTIATYNYVGPSRVESRVHNANGTTSSYSYSTGRLITGVPYKKGTTTLDTRTNTWNAADNKASRVRAQFGLPYISTTFDYDSAHRMTKAGAPTFTLDDAGNRTAVTIIDAGDYVMKSTTPTFDLPVNQYTITPFDARTYDAGGNLLTARALVVGDLNYDGVVNTDDAGIMLETCFSGLFLR